MIRETAYNLLGMEQFLDRITGSGFHIGDDYIGSSRDREPVAVLLPYGHSGGILMVIPQDRANDSPEIKDERRKLRDLADKF